MASKGVVPQRGRMWLRARLRYWAAVVSATSRASNQVTDHSARDSLPASGSMKVPRRWSASMFWAAASAAVLEVKPVMVPNPPPSFG
ncbi:hypothetical protein KIPE111705_46900 [Kibdelosporangium persicum]